MHHLPVHDPRHQSHAVSHAKQLANGFEGIRLRQKTQLRTRARCDLLESPRSVSRERCPFFETAVCYPKLHLPSEPRVRLTQSLGSPTQYSLTNERRNGRIG